MTFCDFSSELVEDYHYLHTCRRAACGQIYVNTAPRHQAICRIQKGVARSSPGLDAAGEGDQCAGQPRRNSGPSVVRKATSFAVAQARWMAAGYPSRSAEQVAEIYAICETCEHFVESSSPGTGACQVCGCQIRRMGGLLNKIQMATESCPIDPPKWAAEVS
jgi:hypothetical protein